MTAGGWTPNSRYVHILFDQSLCKCNTYMANTNLHSFSTRPKAFKWDWIRCCCFFYSCIVFLLSPRLSICPSPRHSFSFSFSWFSFYSCLICSSICLFFCFCLVRFVPILVFLFGTLFTLSFFLSFFCFFCINLCVWVCVVFYFLLLCLAHAFPPNYLLYVYKYVSVQCCSEQIENTKNRVEEKRLPGLIDCDTCNAVAWLLLPSGYVG